MNIIIEQQDTNLNIKLEGRLDTISAPQLSAKLNDHLANIKTLVFDFDSLEYISSAGLRVILLAQQQMNDQGKMIIKNVNDNIMEIFELTGFVEILTIE